jgi:hypothetical protein
MAVSMADIRPQKVEDETVYEFLRDEWELLLAVGTGPTERSVVVSRLGHEPTDLDRRLAILEEVGLLSITESRYAIIPAIHQRQEGMSSCLRDLVIRRMELGDEEPFAYCVRSGLGTASAIEGLIKKLDEHVIPKAYNLGSVQAEESSKRYLMVFAAASGAPGSTIVGVNMDETTEPLIRLLRQAAIERSSGSTKASAKLWIADVHVNEDVALHIGKLFEEFLVESPSQGGTGSAGFAIIESEPRHA